MTKVQFIDLLAGQAGITKILAKRVLQAYSEVVRAALQAGEIVTLPGLLRISFRMKAGKPEHQMLHPATQQYITVAARPAYKRLVLKASEGLLDAVTPDACTRRNAPSRQDRIQKRLARAALNKQRPQ